MILKPQDILVLLKLVALREKYWSYNKLAIELGMSPAEVHAAARRAQAAHLAVRKGGRLVPNPGNLGEFLVHGLTRASAAAAVDSDMDRRVARFERAP